MNLSGTSARMLVFRLAVIIHLFLQLNAFVCPKECECILKDAIHCSGSSIKDLASLGLPTNMTQILITSTKATELKDKVFSGMTVLQRLILSSNQLSLILPGAFKGLVKLKTLILFDNKLTQLPTGVFDEMVDLQQLILEKNLLKDVERSLFDKLVNLQELFLNKNHLTELPDGVLRNLAKLKLLNLSRNYLAVLPRNIFSTLTKLEKLTLYMNRLSSIDSGVFDNLRELQELLLHSNDIQSIALGAFRNLLKLNSLTLSRNKLQLLPHGLFLHLHNLTKLTLYGNPLGSLPEILFGEIRTLRSLWVYDTKLSTVPDFVFGNLTDLELLVLTFNPELSVLPRNVFSGLHELRHLSLHTNNLSTLPEGIFQGLQKLQEISLFNNRIEVLPKNLFYNLNNLQAIYLNCTSLQSLPGDFFASLPKLQEVVLDNNPWKCDCQIAEFKGWLQRNLDIVKNVTFLTCDSPIALRNISLLSLPDDHFHCPSTTALPHHTPESSTRSHTASVLVTEHLPFTWKTPTAPVPVKHTNIPLLPPPATPYFTDSITGDVELSEFHPTEIPIQLPTGIRREINRVREMVSTTAAPVRGSQDCLSAWPFFKCNIPYCQIFLSLYVLAVTVQVLTVVTTFYVVYEVRQLVHCSNSPAQSVGLVRILHGVRNAD
ncbi:platelet glycoprotein V isoform X1 [Mauremys reevesii]|uniref:platelet glycoprotein V isoform X1 n=2 Tax=Mauremys reevesii TaxID=260615 RepID=UPI00193FD43C|nr:platelet glycoprotein V isoform X1 [Mauremys reevesii]